MTRHDGAPVARATRQRRNPAAEAAPAPDVSVVMPCLNEARTLEQCILTAQGAAAEAGLRAEIIVADNGSTDGSADIARRLGARVVSVAEKGYGSALMGGIAAATAELVVMGDADESYDFGAIPRLIEKLRDGADLVVGNRFEGGIDERAMPWLHRLGNPVLSGIGRIFFHSPVRDFHCGLRGFRRDAIGALQLTSTGMEFASEMIIKASLHGLRISEMPVRLRRDGRDRAPHLRTWRDGWRHLRFMLLYSPRWLFLVPGVTAMLFGSLLGIWLIPGGHTVFGIGFDIQTLLVAGLMVIVGYQLVVFALFTKVFVMREGLHPADPRLNALFRHIRLETGLLAGLLMTVAGTAVLFAVAAHWAGIQFGRLDPEQTMRVTIPAAILVVLGVQTIFASFFLSILGVAPRLNDRRDPDSSALTQTRPPG